MTDAPALRVMIIEDEPLIAMHLEGLMIDAGFLVSGIAGRLASALALIERDGCDVALLDANLAGVSSGPAGVALSARGVPFLVLSGYSSVQQEGAFPGAASFMQKPFIPARLIDAVRAIGSKA
jgi:DNA-binding response OmpR family regulator